MASIGDAKSFENGRQLAAWLGLVPRQHSSGGKSVLLGISKRGDTYLRTLLIHGARAVIRFAENKPVTSWLNKLLERRNKNVAAVALANKNARIVWALLMHKDRKFHADYAPAVAGTWSARLGKGRWGSDRQQHNMVNKVALPQVAQASMK